MAAGGNDRLSELPNDLLCRILHFAPLMEAASTTALSRRWRTPLWLSSGGVNLETGMETYSHRSVTRFFSRRNAFESAAAGALGDADVPVTRLTLRLESYFYEPVGNFKDWYRDDKDKVSSYTALVDTVLSHRATRRVEQLQLITKDPSDYNNRVGIYTVALRSLPYETLRVLELTNSKGLRYDGEAVLPQLSSLRLSHSVQHLSSLQRVIDAAPALVAIRLESVRMVATNEDAKDVRTCRLRCPTANVLVLDSCTWEEKHTQACYEITVDVDGVEIDTPRLRRFKYKGLLFSFSLCPLPLELEQVDLDFSEHGYKLGNKGPNTYLEMFWQFARSFTRTREMRLRVDHLEDIAVRSEAWQVELLPAFLGLERLELQGMHWMKDKTRAVTAILNMLRCCPALGALRINLTIQAENHHASNEEEARTPTAQKEIQIAAMLGPRHLFPCLQTSLRRVCLQFRLEKSDCLGVKLIKFFAKNAMVLEEIHIDGRDEKLCENMNPKAEKWNSKRKKLGATRFVILPLK